MIFTKYLLRCVIAGIKALVDAGSELPQDIIEGVIIAVGFTVCMVTAAKHPGNDFSLLVVARNLDNLQITQVNFLHPYPNNATSQQANAKNMQVS